MYFQNMSLFLNIDMKQWKDLNTGSCHEIFNCAMLLFWKAKDWFNTFLEKKEKKKRSLLRVNTEENSMHILQKKLKIELPYDPAIPLPGIYSKELKSGTEEITELQCSMQHYYDSQDVQTI